ncbi:hypothetical protein IWW36_000306 [Coemansia brasiliensis]|uniref:PH domain-containing protein n=1 Tax=Coemansia brasiliensis TaxID=2650707 RepID=A0A9W8IBD7_9FUNG|nr:hypothetical protein IWW36_000306 [Coemansia brasiliensis]
MANLAPVDMVGAIGFLQKKSRFYGWSKHVFLLNQCGLAQLSTERQSRSAKPVHCLSPDVVIGSLNGIDLKYALAFKHKNFINLSDMAYIAGQGSRELAITATSNIIVLRAQTTHERNQWLDTLQQAVQCADKQGRVDTDQISHVEETEGPSNSISHKKSPAQSSKTTKPDDMQPLLLELTLASDSSDKHITRDLGLGAADARDNTDPASAMGWLPSMSNLVDPAAVPKGSIDISANGDIQLQALSNDGTYMPPASNSLNETKLDDSDRVDNSRKVYVDMDAASFDADRFFEEGDNEDSADVDDLPSAGVLVGAGSKSELPLTSSKSSHSAKIVGSPNLTLLGQGQPNLGLGSAAGSQAAFGDFFGNFLSTLTQPSQDLVSSHAEMKQSNILVHGAETLSMRGATSTYSMLPQASGNRAYTNDDIGGSSSSSSSNVPLGVLGAQHVSSGASLGTSNIQKSLQNDAVTSNVAEPSVVLNSSIADIATSLLDTIGLSDYSTLLNNPSDSSGTNHGSADLNGKKPPQIASNNDHENLESSTLKPSAKSLDPPGQYSLGSQSIYKLKSAVSSNGLRAENKMRLDDPPGLQTALLAKYSDSLNSSRALLSSTGGIGKPKTMHDWQANTNKANAERGMERTAPIVQYHAAKPTDNGISKVVRGHLTKEIIQKEAERKPAVRRIRRTKSDTKVPPLKAIRLKLNGSIVSSQAAESKEPSSRGLGYVVKDGRIESLASQNGLRASLPQSSSQDKHGDDNGNSSSQASPDALSEFSEIQRRLKQAEQHKRQLQQARMLDKNASDGVCIADILETRQDIPLAVQLEERRRVQAAKQQALLNQQIQQQRIQMDIQRQNMEQQQKYEQFKRQSLCPPDIKSGNRMSTISVSQPYTTNGWSENGSNGLTSQPQINYSGSGYVPGANSRPYSMYQSSIHYPQQQPSRPTTPISVYEPHMAWNYQQQQQHGTRRPLSQHTQGAIPSTQSVDSPARTVNRSYSTTTPRRQAGSAFVKSERPYAKSEHSDASTESWQSHVAHSTRTSLHANTDSLKNGSVFIPSPTQSAAVSKRSSSFGYGESRRSASSQPDMQTNRFHPMHARGSVPPVPPIPQHIASGAMPYPAYSQYGPPPAYMQPVPQGVPGYPQPPMPHGQWGAPPIPSAHSWNSPYPPAAAPYPYQGYGGYDVQQSTIEAQRIQRKRTEMAAKIPSLLQQLNEAQVTGIMPGQSQEKPAYSKGGYQNANVPKIIRENSGAHYLGNGNTLLIDRVHESEKTKRAFLKKVSRNYTGVGGDTAPTPVFMH